MTADDPLTTAKRLLGIDPAGALAAARAAYTLKATPEAILLLATASRRVGDPATAVRLLRPLAAAAPRAWGVHHELGVALAAMGDEAAAITALEQAVAINPDASGPRHALNDLRRLAGRAIDDRIVPALADPALRTAVAAFLDADEGARETLVWRFALDPDDSAAACLIGEIGLALDRPLAVADLLARAVALAPAYRPARFRLTEALHRAERDAEALAALTSFGDDLAAPIIALRGAILMRLGREDDALADFAKVAAIEPARATVHLALGHALRAVGRRDDAIAAYRQALAIDETLAEAWWSIADLKTAAFGDGDRAAMATLVARPDLPVAARSQVEFALGRAAEDDGDYAEAFAHYDAGNALRRSIESFDEAAHIRFLDALIATTDADFFAARTGWGDPDPAPIFIVGMPRSGSTLVEQILASHSRVEGLSELPEVTHRALVIPDYPAGLTALSAPDLATFGTDYLARVRARQRTDAPHVIDKFPGNAFHIPLIHLMLPKATIIDVRRDPRDCCVSLFAQSFAAGQGYSYDLGTLGRQYARYETLMRHIDTVLPGRVLRVSYEALVDDQEGETRRLLDHCGLDFEPATLRFFDRQSPVRTPSSEQVRQPIYRSAIGRWRRFAPWLDPLLDALT